MKETTTYNIKKGTKLYGTAYAVRSWVSLSWVESVMREPKDYLEDNTSLIIHEPYYKTAQDCVDGCDKLCDGGTEMCVEYEFVDISYNYDKTEIWCDLAMRNYNANPDYVERRIITLPIHELEKIWSCGWGEVKINAEVDKD